MYLKYLKVKNFALIDELSIDLDSQFCVITGETGAGKSIIIEAVGLILGNRSYSEMIREGAIEASVEALFIKDKEELIIKRIINKEGVNKIFINDELSTLNNLKKLAISLGEICGQHEPQGLTNPETQLKILDQIVDDESLILEVDKYYSLHSSLNAEFSKLKLSAETKDDRLEYLKYQLQEIKAIDPQESEEEQVEQEIQKIKGLNNLLKLIKVSNGIFYEDHSVLSQLESLKSELRNSVKYDEKVNSWNEDLESLLADLEKIAGEINKYGKRLNLDEEKLSSLYDRLDNLQKIKKRFGGSIANVLKKKKEFEDEIKSLENISQEIQDVRLKLDQTKKTFLEKSSLLHSKRLTLAKKLQEKITKELHFLNMPKASLVIEVKQELSLMTAKGNSLVTFKISPNEGEGLKDLAKIASGGELSRVMLAISQVLSDKDNKFYVFDEIDAGIGGETGSKIGQKLKSIGDKHQVICVTHLAQVAVYANQHIYINKKTVNKRTISEMHSLNKDDRVKEIARMLGGVSDESLTHAKSMIKKVLS